MKKTLLKSTILLSSLFVLAACGNGDDAAESVESEVTTVVEEEPAEEEVIEEETDVEEVVEEEEPTVELQDGEYAAVSNEDQNGWAVRHVITVEGGEITDSNFDYVNATGELKSEDDEYNEMMEEASGVAARDAAEQLDTQLVENQSAEELEVVSGATTTSETFNQTAEVLIAAAIEGNTEEINIDGDEEETEEDLVEETSTEDEEATTEDEVIEEDAEVEEEAEEDTEATVATVTTDEEDADTEESSEEEPVEEEESTEEGSVTEEEEETTEEETVDEESAEEEISEEDAEVTEEDTTEALQDGEYTAVSNIDETGWAVQHVITVENGEITESNFDYTNEDGDLKSEDDEYNDMMEEASGVAARDAAAELDVQLVESQAPEEVDVVAGATSTSETFVQTSELLIAAAIEGNTDEINIDELDEEDATEEESSEEETVEEEASEDAEAEDTTAAVATVESDDEEVEEETTEEEPAEEEPAEEESVEEETVEEESVEEDPTEEEPVEEEPTEEESAEEETETAELQDGEYTVTTNPDENDWSVIHVVTVVDGAISESDYNYVNAEGDLKTEDADYSEAFEEVANMTPEEAFDALNSQLVETQSGEEIEVVTGATESSNNFRLTSAAALIMAENGITEEVNVDELALEDGEYAVDGENDETLTLTVESNEITAVTYEAEEADQDVIDGLIDSLIETQNPQEVELAEDAEEVSNSFVSLATEAINQAKLASLVAGNLPEIVTEEAEEESTEEEAETETSEEDAEETSDEVTDEYTDGTYTAEVDGHNGPLEVEVTIEDGVITAVEVLSHEETAGISDPAIEEVPAAIVENNSTEVDIVSGATVTSEAIIEAVNLALEDAQ